MNVKQLEELSCRSDTVLRKEYENRRACFNNF